ncbi:hypothetical protein N7486_000589 [Penicillium sp. IBT 16267x]|nr:hypothetical protein N7486_000589 [Penicillium sp. IBT 16267x]
MPTNLSILVFVASPLDYARYRHTALYFEFEPQAQAPATNNPQTDVDTEYIKSSVMEYYVLRSRTRDPRIYNPDFNTDITPPVCSLENAYWNNQNWVGDALGRLVGAGYLDSEARDRALDAMVDAIMEAEDEEISVVGR